MGRERVSSFRDSEDKENGNDQNMKSGRMRSPAPSKGTKNFMSPTISAASKITVSPRKKVLSERNEPVQSSVSFADVRHLIVEDSEATTPVVTMKKNKSGGVSDSLVMESDGLKESLKSDVDVVDGADSVSRSFTDDKDFVNVGPSFKINPPCPPLSPLDAPALAPLDADPLMRPYDPKTNYLSPRPQFLHYRPNPRIEHFRESGGIQLEDSFESENETECTEETESEDSQREEVSSSEMVEEEEEEEVVNVSEPNPVNLDGEEKIFEAKTVLKKHFFGRKSLMTVVLLLAVAYFSFSATDSPTFASPMFNGMDLSNVQIPFGEVRGSVKAYYDDYSQNVDNWSSNSYISKLISRLSGVQEFGPLPYANLSSLLEDHQTSDGYLTFGLSVFVPIEKKEEVITEALGEKYGEIEENQIDQEESEEDNETLFEEDQADDEVGAHENLEVASDEAMHQQTESKMIEADHLAEDVAFAAVTEIKPENNIEVEDQQGTERANDIQPEDTEAEGSSENPPEVEFQSTNENSESLSFWNTIKDSVSKLLPIHSLLGISLLLLCLLASVPLINRKKGQSSVQEATIQVQAQLQPLLRKKLDHVVAASISVDDHTCREQFSSRNWQTEVDMVHDYCPSEMSSYGKSASYSTKKGEEAQSQETKPKKQCRRESLASSDCSMGTSPSYGSFTTYEKIPRKKNADEEIVTPVRRSSRIRKTDTK